MARRSLTARRTARAHRHVVAFAAVAALVLAGCGDPDDDQAAEPDPVEDVEPDDEATPPEEPEVPEDADADDGVADGVADGADDATGDEGVDTDAGPAPDPELVDDPCGPDEGREGEGFITVVSPVADQLVSGDRIPLVGCSNVFEANVQWSLYDVDGVEVANGFTTAECGNGCVGAFRDEVLLTALEGDALAELQVYSEDASDGEGDQADDDGRLHVVTIPLVLG